jgi:hypothetical protein
MAHSDPSQIFIYPVKDTIRSTLIAIDPGFTMDSVSFNAIERDRSLGASVLLSSEIPPIANRKDEKSHSGSTGFSWRGADGVSLYERFWRSSLIVCFDVRVWAPSLEQSTRFLFQLIATLPRICYDGHLQTDALHPEDDFLGNVIDLSVLSPRLPDDKTATSKTYYSSCIVRADGGIYHDAISKRQVSGIIRPATPFL